MSSLSSYEFGKLLGRGFYGIVYKARRKRDRKICVCKQVSLKSFKTSREKTQALSEARILKQLRCAHIVEYFDAFVERDHLYLVMQFCEGGDLQSHLQMTHRQPLPERKIWRMSLHMALGLKYLHGRRIMHRDLKSENVFLTGKEDGVKIGDLGLAKMLTNTAVGASTLCGTPRYLSPEEAKGSKHYDYKSDVWALGVIVYELCSEEHRGPFDEANTMPLLLQHIVEAQPPPLPQHLDENLKFVCNILMEKDFIKRPNINELLAMPCVAENAEKHGVVHPGTNPEQEHEGLEVCSPRKNTGEARSSELPGSARPAEGCALGVETSCKNSDTFQDVASRPPAAESAFNETASQRNCTSKLCEVLKWRGAKEAPGAPRFRRLNYCEICVAQESQSCGFTACKRRHHCRNCGRSVCRQHSQGSQDLPQFNYQKPQRICELCDLNCREKLSPRSALSPGSAAISSLPSGQVPLVVALSDKALVWDAGFPNESPRVGAQGFVWAGVTRIAESSTLCALKLGAENDGSSVETSSVENWKLQRSTLLEPCGIELESAIPCCDCPPVSGTEGLDYACSAQMGPGAPKSKTSPQSDNTKAVVVAGLAVAGAAASGNWIAVLRLATWRERGPGYASAICISDLCSGQCLGHLFTHDTIAALAVVHGENGLLMTGGNDGIVRAWGVPLLDRHCNLLGVFPGHCSRVSSIVASTNGLFMCAGAKEGRVRVWRRQRSGVPFKAHHAHVCEEHRAAGSGSISIAGTLMAFVQVPRLGSWEQGASLWDLAIGRWEHSFFRSGHSVQCVALCGVFLATSSGPDATHPDRGYDIQLWYAATGMPRLGDPISCIQSPGPVRRLLLADAGSESDERTSK
eukprot:gnl/MRDRNA2_/MRDRNA2_62841_c0_seq1.p1 gnl/MRDRNA2_/MRDRNA2_62841_c0~~gnl/MRDRNA2_/MRDRNA2_62841_c0_seq1.p1  ORF type:complete len:860 (+),score=114.16 gnl/MRDRNA2_/MRDRNA2_62841_c0_seq1:81-2660(+)